MWFDLLDHWQTFAAVVLTVGAAFIAGVFALGAAFIAVRAARQQERRVVEALRLSMAAEIRRLVDIMLRHMRYSTAFLGQANLGWRTM